MTKDVQDSEGHASWGAITPTHTHTHTHTHTSFTTIGKKAGFLQVEDGQA